MLWRWHRYLHHNDFIIEVPETHPGILIETVISYMYLIIPIELVMHMQYLYAYAVLVCVVAAYRIYFFSLMVGNSDSVRT